MSERKEPERKASSKTQESEKSGLLQSGAVVSLMTMISRVFGLARDMVIAYFFGASPAADAFFLAFRIPNLFRRLFAEGAFAQAFVPVLSEYRARGNRQEVRDLIDRVTGALGLVLLGFTVFGVLGAELLISVFAPGFQHRGEVEKFNLAVDILRLTFPYLFLISMTALSGSILNTYGRFAVPAFTPVFLNVSLILCAIILPTYLQEPVMALAWGVLLAGVVQLTFQLPFLARIGFLPVPKPSFKDPGVRKIGLLMLPAIFGASVSQINLLVDTILASFLETGSLSWLYYADRLLELPLALIGITLATVILPDLSRGHVGEDSEKFNRTLNWALKTVVALGLPATVALVILSDELIAALFFQGQMTARDVSMSGLALAAYGLGLLGHMWVKVLAPGYFARQDTRTPVRIGIIAMVTNIVLNLLLVTYFQHVGLALATTIAAFVNAFLLFRGLRRESVLALEADWVIYLLKVAVAAAVMGAVLLFALPELGWWLERAFWVRISMMMLICAGGAVIYGASLWLLGINARQFLR